MSGQNYNECSTNIYISKQKELDLSFNKLHLMSFPSDIYGGHEILLRKKEPLGHIGIVCF